MGKEIYENVYEHLFEIKRKPDKSDKNIIVTEFRNNLRSTNIKKKKKKKIDLVVTKVDYTTEVLKRLHLGNGNARLPYKKMRNFLVDGIFEDVRDNPKKLIPTHGYVKGSTVYIWFDKKPKNSTIPSFYYDKELKDYIFINPLNTDTIKEFSVDRIRDISIERINKDLKENEELYTEEQMEYITRSQSDYRPTINPDDDFLKQIVKELILTLNINVNKFTSKFKEKHTLINMKTGLVGKTKTSPKIFSKWMELFKLDFTIVVNIKGVKDNKHNGYILYKSKDNQIGFVSDIHKSDFD